MGCLHCLGAVGRSSELCGDVQEGRKEGLKLTFAVDVCVQFVAC